MTDLADLIERGLEGRCDAREQRELAHRLAADPGARQAWWAMVAWRSQLRTVLEAARSEASGRQLVAQRRRRARHNQRLHRLPWLAMAAAAVICIGVSGWLLRNSAVNTSAAPTAVPNEMGEQYADRRELRLNDGSHLLLQGARFRLDAADGSRISLLSGTVTATIAPRPSDLPVIITTPFGVASGSDVHGTLATDSKLTLLTVASGTWELSGRMAAAGQSLAGGSWGISDKTRVIDPAAGPTLSEACAHLGPDETIVLAAGVHQRGGNGEALASINVQAQAHRPARIVAAPGTQPIVTGTAWDVLRITGKHLVMSGLQVMGASNGGGNGVVLTDAEDVRIEACRFSELGGDGINIHRSNDLTISDSIIERNGRRSVFGQGGISIFRGSGPGNILLQRLRITDNRTGPTNRAVNAMTGGHGLLIGRETGQVPRGNLRIESCIIARNSGPGLNLIDGGEISVRDCLILSNGSGPVGDLRTQLTLNEDSSLHIADSTIATDPGIALFTSWPPARITHAEGNLVWGANPPGSGFLPMAQSPRIPTETDHLPVQ